MLIYDLIPVFVVFIILFILMGLLFLLKHYRKHTGRRAPFTGNLLRSPGESLRLQIEEINEKIVIDLIGVITFPMFFFSGIRPGHNSNLSDVAQIMILPGAISLILIIVFGIRLVRHLQRRYGLRLGYEGELAVGQELNQLMLNGYRVYHDFQCEKFNIDHHSCPKTVFD